MKLKDSIDISALAAAVADQTIFEEEEKIEINEVATARMRFEECLKYNLELNDNMMPDMTKVYDKIVIHKFIVYHVVNNDYIVRYDVNSEYQYVTQYMEFDGTQKTPDGKVIEGETIYVEIGTKIKGFLKQKSYQYIRSCVDIVGLAKKGE